jgi:hypothetical protein
MGKEEYLKARMAKLEKTIKKRKAAVADYNTVQPPSPGPPSKRKTEAEQKDNAKDGSNSSSPARPAGHDNPPSPRRRSRSPRARRVLWRRSELRNL